MFEYLRVDGFKGLDDVQVGPLRRINLVVGPGGSGKTSLMEAIFVHCGLANPALLATLQGTRGAATLKPGQLERLSKLCLSAGPGADRLMIEGAWAGLSRRTEITLEDRPSSVPADPQTRELLQRLNPQGFRSAARWSARTVVDGEEFKGHLLWTDQGPGAELPSTGSNIPGMLVPLSLIETGAPLAVQWTTAEELGFADEILRLVQKFDPDVLSIKVAASLDRTTLRIHHRVMGAVDEPNLLGSWLPQVLRLALHLPSNRGGACFFDEFDGPLHVGLLRLMARFLLAACTQFNVQLFATTHRLETIDAFLEIDEVRAAVSVLRSRRRDGRISFETLSGEQAWELREEVGVDLRRTL